MPRRADSRGRLLAAALCLLPLAAAAPAAAEPLNRIVLQVNGRIATLREFEDKLALRRQALEHSDLDAAKRQQALAEAPQAVMRDMFEDLLLQSRADQLGIRVTRQELEALIAEVREANRFADDTELRRAIEQSGGTWEQFREQLSASARYRELVGREVQGRISLEEDDLRIFYRDNPELFRVPEERKLREVVVLDTSPLSAEARLSLATEIGSRADAGDDLEEIVAETSKQGTTSGVIDLDWVPEGDLDPALEQAVAGLAVGKTSTPVEARGGLHVLQLVDRHEAHIRPFDEVKGEIEQRERERLFAKEFPKYMVELEQKSYVIENPPPEAVGFRKADATVDPTDPLNAFRRKADGETAKPEDETPSANGKPSGPHTKSASGA
jgi:parvulin-like peptidyl-prolyl isomerase